MPQSNKESSKQTEGKLNVIHGATEVIASDVQTGLI